jgi:glutamate synthase domain-containing protein 1
MLSSMGHRGPDSSGVAIYNQKKAALTLRVAIEDPEMYPVVEEVLTKQGVSNIRRETHPRYDLVVFQLENEDDRTGCIRKLTDIPSVQLHSMGSTMTIVKDTISPESLEKEFNIHAYKGSHGIGHVRLATESKVACGYAHPFQSLDLPDLSIVHNGTITNYHKMRRMLERKGFRFQTDNDSEAIAQTIAYGMIREGKTFEHSLREVHGILDGTYSFIVASPGNVGIAKDRLAAKPMMLGESDWGVAISSEEIAIRSVFGDKAIVKELPPNEVRTWRVSS